MAMTFYRHPNLIKVANSYLMVTFLVLSVFVGISLNLILIFFLLLFLLQKWTSRLLSKEVKWESNQIDIINYKSYFLANAYGVGLLSINKKSYFGIHIDDYNKIRGLNGRN